MWASTGEAHGPTSSTLETNPRLNDPAVLAILSGRISDTRPAAGQNPDSYLIDRAERPTLVFMARFRETLWFKKGNETAPQPEETGDSDRPIEDRYEDDGSISLLDHAQFSVVTGTTQPVRIFKKLDADDPEKTMQLMVGQMSSGRGKVYAMIGASMACAVAVVAMFVA